MSPDKQGRGTPPDPGTSKGSQKRVSFGDVTDFSKPRRSSSCSSRIALTKFKSTVKVAVFTKLVKRHHYSTKLRHFSDGQISPFPGLDGAERERLMNQKTAGRRGTVHGSQMYMEGQSGRRRMTEENIGRVGSSNISAMIANAKAKQDTERKKKLQKLRLWGKVVGRCCRLHNYVTEKNKLDPMYATQMENIGKDSPLEKDSYGSNRIDLSYFKANTQMRMSQRAVAILTKPPELRTPAEIKYAMNALCNVHFISKFPLKIQRELATYGFVECYEAKRFILKQGGAPENVYIVLYGAILTAILEKHKLSATSVDSLITRGQQFGEIAIYRNKARGGSNITAEYTEVLRIPAEDFKRIFMGSLDPEKDPFLKKFKFLRDWPLQDLKGDPNKYITTYYQRNITLTSDSNRSPWIYIVKEGSLRIMKRLEKVTSNVNKKTGKHNDVAHQDGYLSFLTRELDYERYVNYHLLDLPPPLQYDVDDDRNESKSEVVTEPNQTVNAQALPLLQRLENVLRPHTAGAFLTTPKVNNQKSWIPKSAVNEKHPSPADKTDCKKSQEKSPSNPEKENQPSGDIFNKKIAKRTIYDDFDLVDNDKEHEVTAAERNPQWVQVQTLTKDQVFGLQYVVFEKKKQPQPSFVVISNGAEVVQIDKNLFLSRLDMNAREKLRMEISPYPTDEELQMKLITRINWEAYKHIVLDHVVRERKRTFPSRHGDSPTGMRHMTGNATTQESSVFS